MHTVDCQGNLEMSLIQHELMHHRSFLKRPCIITTPTLICTVESHFLNMSSGIHVTGRTWYERSQKVAEWCAAQTSIHSSTKWQTKAIGNSNLATKIMILTAINVSIHQKDIFLFSV